MECGSQAAKGAKGRMWSSSRWLGVMTAGGGHTAGIQPAGWAWEPGLHKLRRPGGILLDMTFQIVQIVMC